MINDIDLKKLEKKAYLYFHQDGLLDILIGSIILIFGIEMVFKHFWVLPVFSFVMISSWMPLKKVITAPRMGNVVLRNTRQTIWLFVMVFLGTFIFAVTLFFAVKRDTMSGLDIFTMYPLLVVAILYSILLGAGALYFGINRFYTYIISIFLVLVPGQHFYAHEPTRVIITGASIMLYGVVLLIRFLRIYNVPKEEI
ncbi:hypothetical protein ACFL47_05450 [Candidatus Latescibacterota bacterium]